MEVAGFVEVRMFIGYGHLVAVLGEMHPETDERSLDARVRYFQRRGFPTADAAVGKGWRSEYGPADLWKLACSFELLSAFVPPAQAAATIVNSWVGIADTMQAAWLDREKRAFALPVLLRGVVVGETAGEIVAVTADYLRTWLQGQGGDRMVVAFDALRLANALATAITKALPQDRARGLLLALDGWATSDQ